MSLAHAIGPSQSTATSGVSPRQWAARGVVTADAFWFDFGLLSEAEARRRVLALWPHGPQIRADATGWLVTLQQPLAVDAVAAPGEPLWLTRGVLCGVPLEPAALQLLRPAPGTIVRAVGGAVVVTPASALTPVDPSRWLDLRAFAVLPTQSLAASPAAVRLDVAAPAESLRRAAGVDDADAQAVSAQLDAMRAELDRHRALAHTSAGPPSALAAALTGILTGALHLIRRQLVRGQPQRGGTSGGSALTPPRPPPGVLEQMLDRIERWIERTAFGQALSRAVSTQHMRVLQEMLRRFDDGDPLEALRHALPLSNLPTELGGASWQTLTLGNSMDLFGPRATGRGQSVGLDTSLFQHLRRVYREAHAKLDRAGRIEEAAYVLADLLDEPAEAVAYLEQREKVALAAQLAEARSLAPALVIRLWLRAGEVGNALRVARLHAAWAAALALLGDQDAALATQLRLLWAHHRAATGDPAGAVETLGPEWIGVGALQRWLDEARAQGGGAWARALAWQLQHQPERLDEAVADLMPVLDDDAPGGLATRRALADALVLRSGAAVRALAVPLVRQLIIDRNAGGPVLAAQIRSLAALAADGAIDADLPPLAPPAAIGPFALHWHRRDRGTSAIADAAVLDDATLLIALGERGVERRDLRGRLLQRYDVPAERLVIRSAGGVALATMRRSGERVDLARLDLTRGLATPLGPLKALGEVDCFDGDLLFVRDGATILALDAAGASAQGWRALWKVDLAECQPLALRWSSNALVVISAADDGELACWRWTLPGLALRERGALEARVFAIDDKVHAVRDVVAGDERSRAFAVLDGSFVLLGARGTPAVALTPSSWLGPSVALASDWLAIAGDTEAGARAAPHDATEGAASADDAAEAGPIADDDAVATTLTILHRDGGGRFAARGTIGWPAPHRPTLRLRDDGLLCVADSDGRVMLVDCARGEIVTQLLL